MAEPVRATSLSISTCSHGSVFIHLHGAGGEVIAVAAMDPHTACDVLEDFSEAVETAAKALIGAAGKPSAEVH